MAILAMEGFDGYGSSLDHRSTTEEMVIYNVSLIEFSASGGKFGGGALFLDGSGSSSYVTHFAAPALTTKIYVGFWYKGLHPGGSATYAPVCGFYSQNTAARLARLDMNPNGNIRIVPQSGANTDSAAGVLPNNVYCWIEMEFLAGTTASSGTMEVRVNGTTVVSATSQDFNTGALCDTFRMYGNAADGLIDDLVIWDDQGTAPTSWIGESRISSYLPTADGAVMAWTPSAGSAWQCIDDPLNGGTDSDTTYIEADGAGEKARFAMADIPDTTTTIHAVAIKARVKKTAAGVKTMRGYVRSNGTESNGTTIGLVDSYKVRTLGIFPRNPDGNVAWLDAAVNAAEFGVEVIS